MRHAALGALLAAAGVAALGTGTAVAKTDLRVVVAYYSAETGPIFEGMAKEFEQANPDVDVRIEVVQWDNLQQRLTTDIAGGTAPDIAIIGTRSLLDYAAQEIAEPLDQYATPEFRARFIETFFAPSTIEGQLYGLPVAASARAMYYNKALLQKAGVAEPPRTWEELEAAARKVKALGDGSYGLAIQGKEIETDAYWYYALWTHGGELVQGGKSGIASDAGVKAATLYKRMIDEGLSQPDPTGYNRQDVERLFKQGKAAVVLSAPGCAARSRPRRPASTTRSPPSRRAPRRPPTASPTASWCSRARRRSRRPGSSSPTRPSARSGGASSR
jgi:multiple sugar transport system substrate-binding protein